MRQFSRIKCFVVCALLFVGGCLSLRHVQPGGPRATSVEAPASGVLLDYDLEPGQTYQGNVRLDMKVRVLGSAAGFNVHLDYDADLVVRGPDEEYGGTKITGRVSNVKIRWNGLLAVTEWGVAYRASLLRDIGQWIDGLEADYSVDDYGRVVHMPPYSRDLSWELRFVLPAMIASLESAFVPVDEHLINAGDIWAFDKRSDRRGGFRDHIRGGTSAQVEGFYELEGSRESAVGLYLTMEEAITNPDGLDVREVGSGKVIFACDQKIVTSYTEEIQIHFPGGAIHDVSIVAFWKKGPRATSLRIVQDISEPCHSDYVGIEECPADVAPPKPHDVP